MAGHRTEMRFDVVGRLRNTKVPLQHAFLPLFEAVVNSIHSTEDRFGADVSRDGRIDVYVRRTRQGTIGGLRGSRLVDPIVSIEVVDNGCGFNDANIEAFETADSTAKAARGGKGVGRFTWLVVFRAATVISTFPLNNAMCRREFAFKASTQGIEDYREVDADPTSQCETRILLEGVCDRYVEPLRKGPEVIAERLFEHCFNYFVLGRCAQITLHDDAADVALNINARLDDIERDEPAELLVGSHALSIRHIRVIPAADRRHEAHLCAHYRVVTTFPLTQVSELGQGPIPSPDGQPRMHQVFVSGPALDEAVDPTRTRLDLPDGAPLFEGAGALDLRALRQAIGDFVADRLADVLASERRSNFDRIANHIRSQLPEYRHLIKRRTEQLGRTRWPDDPRLVDEELYRIQQEWEADIRRQQALVEQRLSAEQAELDAIAEELFKVVAETNEMGQASLVRYVTKRRAVLNLLTKMTSRFEGPALERQVHQLVFPMRKTGDDVLFDDHNLWLIDDTLSFYEFLASDVRLDHNEAAPSDSPRRPDILALKTGDPFQHIAIVEFKRPDQDDDDPVRQLVEYGQLLRDGGKLDVQGRTLPGIDRGVRIDGYAVATLTPRMEKRLQIASGNIRKVEGDWRWYGTVENLNMTIEVLDFRAFIRRAEQRNRAFFAKLGLGR